MKTAAMLWLVAEFEHVMSEKAVGMSPGSKI
jgi:hypothetical protein